MKTWKIHFFVNSQAMHRELKQILSKIRRKAPKLPNPTSDPQIAPCAIRPSDPAHTERVPNAQSNPSATKNSPVRRAMAQTKAPVTPPTAIKPPKRRRKAEDRANPRTVAKQDRKPKKRPRGGCGCSKSKCLRLHCGCFRNGEFCSGQCGCKNCYNTPSHYQLVDRVKHATRDINAEAFRSRFMELSAGTATVKITKGCSCSKNNCQKNYCECFKHGLPCTPLCRCQNCCNHYYHIEPELASQLFRKSSRKKRKIVFTPDGRNGVRMTQHVLVNKPTK